MGDLKVTITGCIGSGKTVLLARLTKYLREIGYKVTAQEYGVTLTNESWYFSRAREEQYNPDREVTITTASEILFESEKVR